MKKTAIALLVAIAFGVAGIACAEWGIANEGCWPMNWPKQLEPLRKQARTYDHDQQSLYEIPFTSREEFEAAWPHILEVKSKHAAIKLVRGPSDHHRIGERIEAGVRIWAPRTGMLLSPKGMYPPEAEAAVPDGKFLRIGPPWPDELESRPDGLPELVLADNDKWSLFDPNKDQDKLGHVYRARLDIELVVDGKIVDLNRIPLPPDTPIIDERFKDEAEK